MWVLASGSLMVPTHYSNIVKICIFNSILPCNLVLCVLKMHKIQEVVGVLNWHALSIIRLILGKKYFRNMRGMCIKTNVMFSKPLRTEALPGPFSLAHKPAHFILLVLLENWGFILTHLSGIWQINNQRFKHTQKSQL